MRGLILVAALAALAARGEEAISFSLQAGAGSRGDERAEVSARAQLGDGALLIGAETTQGPRSPMRTGLIAGIDYSLEPVGLHGEVRAVPPSVELSRTSLEVGARLEGKAASLGVALLGRSARLRDSALQGVGAQLEGELAAAAWLQLGAKATAWANSLSGSSLSAEPWSNFGDQTLEWSQRWETQTWARVTLGRFALTPQITLSQPAQQGQWAARAGLLVEANLGPLGVSVEGSAAHEWPRTLSLTGVTLGLSWQIGGER